MTQNATQAKKSRSFTVGVNFRLSSYYSVQKVSDMKKMKDMVESLELRFCVLGVMPTLDIYFKIVELPQERDIAWMVRLFLLIQTQKVLKKKVDVTCLRKQKLVKTLILFYSQSLELIPTPNNLLVEV